MLDKSALNFKEEELISILRLASGWGFSTAKEWAISKLQISQKPAMKRLELAHDYKVKEWLEPAYFELCSQSAAWSIDDINQLLALVGVEGFQVLTKLREDYMRGSLQATYQTSYNGYGYSNNAAIQEEVAEAAKEEVVEVAAVEVAAIPAQGVQAQVQAHVTTKNAINSSPALALKFED